MGDTGEAKKPLLNKDNLLVAGLVVYAAVLAVLAADQLFQLGLFPPALDKMLTRDIRTLGDPAAAPEQTRAAREEIVSYHEFSVPHLIKALQSRNTALHAPAAECLQQIGKRFFRLTDPLASALGTDPAKWKQWWSATQAELEKRAT